MPKHVRTTILGLVFLAIAIAVFFVAGSNISKLFLKDKQTTSPNSDAFKAPQNNDAYLPGKMWEAYKGPLKDTPDGETIFMYGLDVAPFDHNVTWDRATTPFWASILELSADATSAKIKFLSPTTQPYIDQEKDVKLVGCTSDNSFLTVQNPKSVQVQLEFFEKARVGDELISFCLNDECTEVGKLCKIYRQNL